MADELTLWIYVAAWLFLFFCIVGVGHTIRWVFRGIRKNPKRQSFKNKKKLEEKQSEEDEDAPS